MDGSTLGASGDASDFYVLQSLQDGTDCDVAYTAGLTTLNAVTEPAITGSQSTTTLVNIDDWPRGDNVLCLRMKLMLQMSDDNDVVWHQMDFKFTVTVNFADGSADVTYTGTGAAESMTFENDGLQTGSGSDTGIAPTFTTDVVGGPFAYGQDIPITITFIHPLDVFTYSVDAANALPVDDSNNQLSDGANPITLRSSTFVMDSTDHNSGIQGTLSITLPLVIYQMTAIDSVRVLIPVSWVNNGRRNLRALTEEVQSGKYTGPPTGVVDEVVQVELLPYTDESGAIVGFTIGSVISTVCMGTAALLI